MPWWNRLYFCPLRALVPFRTQVVQFSYQKSIFIQKDWDFRYFVKQGQKVVINMGEDKWPFLQKVTDKRRLIKDVIQEGHLLQARTKQTALRADCPIEAQQLPDKHPQRHHGEDAGRRHWIAKPCRHGAAGAPGPYCCHNPRPPILVARNAGCCVFSFHRDFCSPANFSHGVWYCVRYDWS